MKPSLSLQRVTAILLLVVPLSALAQVTNTSSKTSYKQRVVKTTNDYSSEYDNGYVKLRDGTILSGQISITGPTFEDIRIVKIRTNGGDKYVFRMKSLTEFGLSNNLVNDTPDLFKWNMPMEKSAFTGFQEIRIGETNFGYVKTKDGKNYQGNLTIREVNGRVEHITVKDDKKKTTKIDADNITNFGAQQYADKKFEGVWSLVPWRTPKATGLLVNIKTEPLPGVVIQNDGKELKGMVTLFKKEEMITQIEVAPESGGKAVRIKYPEVKSYRMEQRVKDYDNVLKTEDTPYELIPPARKFFRGKVLLVDGTLKEGLIAKAADLTYTDIYYAPDESGMVEGIPAADVEVAVQDIPEQIIKDYKKLIYDREYVLGYKIQDPPQWIYKSQTGGGGLSKLGAMTQSQTSETEWQQGYIILADGTKKVGALSVLNLNGQITLSLQVVGKEKEKYKDFKAYGLIENQPKTEFPANLFKKKGDGFIVLLGSEAFIKGPLAINTITDTKTGNQSTEFVVGKEKYDAASVDLYGLLDVPARQLTGDGIVNMTDPRQNFNPGSFVMNGQKKTGFIAWCSPNYFGEYFAFYFAEKPDGPANIYYTSKGASNVQQEITEEIKPYDPLEDSYLSTKTIDKEVKNNGYVITASGEKIEGAIQLSFPPKLWFATDVTLTKADGTVLNYRDDGSLKKIGVTIDGVEKEFVNYDNAYAEVLHREGTLVHFRNPHPTTPTFVSQLTQQVVGDFLNELDKEMQAYAAATGSDPSEAGLTNRQGERVDWTNEAVFKMYEKEYIIMDEKDGRHTMYIPNKSFYRMDAELMGCVEYLTLDREEQAALRKVQNPVATMKFLNENMNN